MDRITLAAHAKINLSLRILGKREDGFHELETLMTRIDLHDDVEIMHGAGDGISFTCNDPDLPSGSDNLCVKAANAFRDSTGLDHGMVITLMKRIPHGAGLGGGSSDAAAVLLGLNELFDYPLVSEELHRIAAMLGSDVPFFLGDGPSWCRGRGEILEPAEILLDRDILLIKPPFSVSTAWAYQRYAAMQPAGHNPSRDNTQWMGNIKLVNDLEAPVFEKFILLAVMKNWLRGQPEVESVLMSGSGSTMVVILVPEVGSDRVSDLRERITADFGPALWMCESRFLSA